jgi:tripeptidyl-peptidase-1
MLKYFLVSALALGANAQYVLHSAPTNYHGDWQAVARAPATEKVRFTIAVKEQNMDEIRRYALEVSNPKSSKFGQYLTQKEINLLTRPAQSDFDRVFAWLHSHNLKYEQQEAMITVSCSVEEAEKLLQTQFRVLASEQQGQKVIKAGDYQLPASVEFSVRTIFGLHGLPLPKQAPLKSKAGVAKVDPAVLASTYNIGGVSVDRSEKVRQAVAEFQGQLMSQTDLTNFFKQYVNSSQTGDDQVYKYVGNPKQTGEGIEALLDIEYIMGVAVGVKTEFWEWKQNDFCHDLNGWTTEILSEDDVPVVHSVSYGWQGALSQLGCQASDKSTVEDNFSKIAAKGISIILASGDSGSGYGGFPAKMYPSWPASSPWVTAVGATRFVNQEPGQPEMATDQFGSGGGFSTDFKQSPNAAWQSDVVKAYLSSGVPLPTSTLYDPSGRATPDISALGEGYQVVVGGRSESVGGTSASTPAFAGMVGLINDARAQAGKKPMGFLNQFIYQNADSFKDVTQGNNKIGRGGQRLAQGWECTKGWDPATGLGTPIFDKLLAAALALP